MEQLTVGCCVILALLALRVSALDEEMAELAKMLRENCADETKVDLSLVDKVNAGAQLMPDEKLKCYIKCIMETAGMMSEGTVDVETVIALLPDDMRKKNENSLRACGTKKGADDCATAFLTQQNESKVQNIYMSRYCPTTPYNLFDQLENMKKFVELIQITVIIRQDPVMNIYK